MKSPLMSPASLVQLPGSHWGCLRASFVIGLLTAALSSPRAAEPTAAPSTTVPLPQGTTALADIGLYRVGWQSYGREPVAMPLSWTGHFDGATGISCQPWGRVLNREALLLHSPWRVPPGRTWVDYELALPRVTPIRLSFSIAIGPDVARPDRSDGVTFSCAVTAGGETRELLRQHHAEGAWRDYAFDLSEFAGRTVTVRLQVEPGPKNNAAFDYSFFGDARISVGEGTPAAREDWRKLISSRAYRANAKASLLPLADTTRRTLTPANLLPHKNALTPVGQSWRFTYDGADGKLAYAYTPATGTLDDFSAQVDDRPAFQPALGGGVTAQLAGGRGTQPLPLRGGRPVEVTHSGNTLRVAWEYPVGDRTVRVDWEFGIAGKALLVSARCDQPVLTALSLGVPAAGLRRAFNLAYLPGAVHFLPLQGVFVNRCLDWTQSHGSQCPQGEARYDAKTDGSRNALREAGFIAISPELVEVFPDIPNPPSPYRAALASRIMLDIWGHHGGTFAGDAQRLRELKDLGVDHLAIIQHVWQRYGYDVKLPDHLPADPRFGGDEGMKLFGQTARDAGYLWSLHENYIDLYPDAPSYDSAARVLLSDGTPSKAWFNEGTGVQSWGLKCNRALGFAERNSPEAHARYGTTAAYLDVHPCVPPWHQLDHEASQPMAAMSLAKLQRDTALFQYERDTHGGPLFGEGANHLYWAGLCDGVEAQVAGGEDHLPLLDFDLLRLHPRMVNHSMGYYERWFRRGYQSQWGVDAGSPAQLDQYRAMEIAYGHAGFLGDKLAHHLPSVVREHHLMHPVQKLYGTARPTEIRYEVGGEFVTAGAALLAGETARQRIRYENGLTIWVNGTATTWDLRPNSELRQARANNVSVLGSAPGEFRLPQWGWLAVGPGTLAGTFTRHDRWADFASCPEFVFADARTMVDQPWARARRDIEPTLRSVEHISGGRIRLSYEWRVGEPLDADYQCFVHFLEPESSRGEGIVFQQDHALPKSTSRWQAGEVIVDGPYELHLPAKTASYDLVVGLHKGQRLRLRGLDDGGSRIYLARLNVEAANGEVTQVAKAPAQLPAGSRAGVVEADFQAHLNPPGTWVDFGPLATDGSVKVNLGTNQLVVFPYPREKRFNINLDLKALAPTADPKHVHVRALAAGNQADLGPVAFRVEGHRLLLTAGQAGLGRWAVEW